ncbi:MAG: DUF4831 family protein [Bacteroidales bacterium]|nr:DUF4831 family protein [Bacteroidales bacterium]
MKRILIFLPVILLLASCASYTVYPVKSRPTIHPKGGMLYALPKTKVCVSVTFNKRNYEAAPYAEFAAEMLGLDKTDVTSPYSIESVSIDGVNEADPNLYYFIYPRRLSVNIDSRHLLRSVGVNHDDYEEFESYTERRGRATSDEEPDVAEYNMYDRADTFYVRGDKVGKPSLVTTKKDSRSLRQRATAAAQRLEDIQTKRQQLLYGDYEGDYSPETLKYLADRLAEQENTILEQFVGRTTSETVRFYVDPKTDRASLDSQTVVLFAFSPKLGLRTGDAIQKGMDTVYCNLHSENTLRNATRFVKQSTKGSRKNDNAGSRRTFKYRQAETVHVSVYWKDYLFETDVRIAQFGPIVDLPKHKFEAIFDRHTGDLIYYKN